MQTTFLRTKAYYRPHSATAASFSGGPWLKSSFSNFNGNCVEVSRLPDGRIAVRDTKDDGAGPVLIFTQAEWDAFMAGAKEGQFDRL